jgi:hypothetical protein
VVALNYFNSVRKGNATAMVKTDLMRVHFGDDDRFNITCNVVGCVLIQSTVVVQISRA